MKIKEISAIGARRPPCEERVRVAAGLSTNTALIRASQAKRKGLPVDQCGLRSTYTVDGKLMCRGHAGAAALAFLLITEASE